MAKLILTDKVRNTTLDIEDYFDRDNELRIIINDHEVSTEIYLKPNQLNELIGHLTKLLKEDGTLDQS